MFYVTATLCFQYQNRATFSSTVSQFLSENVPISIKKKCKERKKETEMHYSPPFFASSFASSPTGWTLSLLVLHPISTRLFLFLLLF